MSLISFMGNIRKFGLPHVFRTIKRKIFRPGADDMGDRLYHQRYYQKLPKEQYAAELSAWYRRATGNTLHLDKPVLFTEKIQWLKLHDSTPLKTLCADKYLAPKWVQEQCRANDAIQMMGGCIPFSCLAYGIARVTLTLLPCRTSSCSNATTGAA